MQGYLEATWFCSPWELHNLVHLKKQQTSRKKYIIRQTNQTGYNLNVDHCEWVVCNVQDAWPNFTIIGLVGSHSQGPN